MTSDIQKWCRVGYYIDAKDNMNEWCIAEVKDVTKTSVKVMMNEWAPKWETIFPIKSSKIAPFRKNSKPNLSSKLRSCKTPEFSLSTLNFIHEKISLAIQSSLLLEDAFHTTQFYRGKLFLYTDSLFSSKPAEDCVQAVISFSIDLLKFIQKWLESCKGLFPFYYQGQCNPDLYLEDNSVALASAWPDITEIFKRLLGIDLRYGDIFSYIDMPLEFSRNLGVCSGDNRSKWTKFFIEKFVNSGFDVIIDIVQNEDEKSRVPFVFLNSFPIYEILELIDSPKTKEFATVFNRAVLKRIEIISESELKDLKHEEIVGLLNRLKKFRVLEGHINTEQLKLIFFIKMLRSGYLEKRIKGLTEINSAIESLENKWSYDAQKLKQSTEEVKKLLYHEDLLNIILTDRPHIELIKRSSTVFKFFAKCQILDKDDILKLWSSVQNKHESYVRATYEVIIELATVLTEQQNDLLYSQIINVKKENFDASFLEMVKEFSVKAIITAKNSFKQDPNLKVYGFEFFKDLIKANISDELNTLGIKNLVGVVAEDICKKIKIDALELARFLVKEVESTHKGIVLFLKIAKNTEKTTSVPEDMLLTRKILSLAPNVISHLSTFLKGCPIADEQNQQKTETTQKVISDHLNFLGQVAERCSESITQQSLDSLWSMFEPRPHHERTIFFNWLSQFSKFRQASNVQHIFYIFRSLFLNNEKFSDCCNYFEEFISFFNYFLEYNRAKNNLELTEQRQVKFRKGKKIKGLEKLVNIFIQSDDENVIEKAGRLIYAVMSRYDSYVIGNAKEIIEELVGFLMELIGVFRDNEKYVMRILVLFQILLDKGEDDGQYNFTVYIKKPNAREYIQIKINQYKTIRHIRKEIARNFGHQVESVAFILNDRKFTVSDDDIEIIKIRMSYLDISILPRQSITEFLPFNAIAENQDFINILFELVSDTTKLYTDLAWSLLLSLPTCKRLKYSILQLKFPIQELIETSSTYKLLYTLKIILKNSQNKLWVENFRAAEGVNFITSVFITDKKGLSIKLKAIKESFILQVLANTIESVKNPKELIPALFRSFKIVAKAVATGEKFDNEKKYFESFQRLITLISKDFPQAFSEFLKEHSLSKHIKYSLIHSFNSTFFDYSFRVFKKLKKNSDCHEELYSQCLHLLEFALTHATRTSGYWDLLSILIENSGNIEITSKIAPFLLEKLETYPCESSSTQKNEVLCGLMKTIKSSINKVPIKITPSQFYLILYKCLCEIPEHSNNSQVPKCKHPETRLNGFLLVLELCKQDSSLLSQVSNTLDCFHNDPSWRTSKKSAWNHSCVNVEKSFTGFVGLKNLGCTCYMASVLQQLFMIPSFRNNILSVKCLPEPDSLLYQLQYIFAGLQASDKQAISPKNFAKALKDPEGNEINVIEQMDVDEFFSSLMDKLENSLKGCGSEDLINAHFGGIQATEIIGKECPHRSEREEPFISLSVEVKNKKTLLEGLESYVAEEILEGENAYQCDHCDRKVKAIRRVCVKNLPNYLVLALRRFEFDFDTMSREKVNDFFDFPFDLNMEAYTQEGLEKSEKKEKNYYMYSLKGIVIHMGTAENGHYFSYICNEGKWLEFNDMWVGLINPQNIPNDCYGGEEKVQYNYYNKSSSREKVGNAYMLVFERNKMFKPLKSGEDSLEETNLYKDKTEVIEVQKIKKQNKKFWVSKIVFSQEYINFNVAISKFEELDQKFVIKFFFTVLIRGKEKSIEIFEVYSRIERDLKGDCQLAAWMLDVVSFEPVCRELLLYNPLFFMRKLVVGLCRTALGGVDRRTQEIFFSNVIQNLKFAKKKHSRHFSQYLELVKHSFFVISSYSQYDCATNMVNFVLNRPFTIPPPEPHQFEDIYLGFDNYNEEHLKDDSLQVDPRDTSICHVFHLIYSLKSSLSDSTKAQLSLPISLNQLIIDTDCNLASKYIGKLFSFLSSENKLTSLEILKILMEYLKTGDNLCKSKIMSILINYFKSTEETQTENFFLFTECLNTLMKQCKNLSDIEYFIGYLITFHCQIPKFHSILKQNPEILNTLETIINNQASVSRVNSMLSDDPIKNIIKPLLSKMETLKKPPPSYSHSEDEIFDKYVPGASVGVIEGHTLNEGKICARAGDILMIEFVFNSHEYFDLRDLTSEEISLKTNLPI